LYRYDYRISTRQRDKKIDRIVTITARKRDSERQHDLNLTARNCARELFLPDSKPDIDADHSQTIAARAELRSLFALWAPWGFVQHATPNIVA
jgi:hypothetical protein